MHTLEETSARQKPGKKPVHTLEEEESYSEDESYAVSYISELHMPSVKSRGPN